MSVLPFVSPHSSTSQTVALASHQLPQNEDVVERQERDPQHELRIAESIAGLLPEGPRSVVMLRFFSGPESRSHAEIAELLNQELPTELRQQLAESHGVLPEDVVVSETDVVGLESQALALLRKPPC